MSVHSLSKKAVWIGRICSGLVVLFLVVTAMIHLFMPERLAADMAAAGMAPAQTTTLGIIALVVALIYAIPATAALGAILITGFLGGAICTHFRMSEMTSPPAIICIVLGVLVWGGLYLRDPRVRALLHGVSA